MDFPQLQKSALFPALSPFGREIFLPQGIFYWSGRAKTEADINATIGTALQEDGMTAHLPSMWKLFGEEFRAHYSPNIFGYAPITGMPALREKWKALVCGNVAHPTENVFLPIVTSGITQGLSLFGWLFCAPGETVLLQEKSWGNYKQIFTAIAQIRLKYLPLVDAEGKIDVIALEKGMTRMLKEQKKVVLLLNFPHNQTGYAPPPDEGARLLSAIADFAQRNAETPVVVGFDDAYEGYVYDRIGDRRSLFLRLVDRRLPNVVAVKLDGVSKQLLAYGLRVGFLTCAFNGCDDTAAAQQELDTKIGGLIRGTVSNGSHVSQAIADMILKDPQKLRAEREATVQLLAERWLLFVEAIRAAEQKFGAKLVRADPFNAGFFSFFNTKPHAKTLAERLIAQYRVACVPAVEPRTDLCTGWNGIRVAFCGVHKTQIAPLTEAIYKAASDVAE